MARIDVGGTRSGGERSRWKGKRGNVRWRGGQVGDDEHLRAVGRRHLLPRPKIGGRDVASGHMVKKEGLELPHVVWVKKLFQGSRGQLSKGQVVRGKHGEGTTTGECVNETPRNQRLDQGRQGCGGVSSSDNAHRHGHWGGCGGRSEACCDGDKKVPHS